MRPGLASSVAVAFRFLGGCGREGGGASSPRSTELYESAFRLGRAQPPDGIATDERNVFNQGDPLYASFAVENAPAGAKVRPSWVNVTNGNTKMKEEDRLLGKKRFVSFHVAIPRAGGPATIDWTKVSSPILRRLP